MSPAASEHQGQSLRDVSLQCPLCSAAPRAVSRGPGPISAETPPPAPASWPGTGQFALCEVARRVRGSGVSRCDVGQARDSANPMQCLSRRFEEHRGSEKRPQAPEHWGHFPANQALQEQIQGDKILSRCHGLKFPHLWQCLIAKHNSTSLCFSSALCWGIIFKED